MDDIQDNSLSWERIAQFHLMEVVALWEGRLTSNHLQNAFSIGRSKASKIMNSYVQLTKNNLIQCTQQKGYIPSDTFTPKYSLGEVHEYLTLLHSGSLLNTQVYGLTAGDAPIDIVQPLTRPVSPNVVRVILTAIRDRKRIIVNYRSLDNPEGTERMIAPHSLVFADGRWHIRAFCENSRKFKDFVLHRFATEPEIDDHLDQIEQASPKNDHEWNTELEMVVIPNPALSPEQQQLVADDYDMGPNNYLKIRVKASLLKYMMVSLHIVDEEQTQSKPNAHQLSLANREVLKDYIFSPESIMVR